MTRNIWESDPNAIEESELFYSFVGKYVISFQWMESKIEQIILLAHGHEKWDETQENLSRLKNEEKINLFSDLVLNSDAFDRVSIEGWYDQFEKLINRLHDERRRRNDLLHAQYIFEFLALGEPILKANRYRKGGNFTRTQEPLSPDRRDEIMTEMANIAFDLSSVCLQLVHLYKDSE